MISFRSSTPDAEHRGDGNGLESVGILSFDEEPVALPGQAGELVEEGRRRADRFMNRSSSQPPGGFLAGDYEGFQQTLRWAITENLVARNARFCEWGSGVGVITLLAELSGLNACGIELQAALVAESRQLAQQFGLRARFGVGSYVPDGWAESRAAPTIDRRLSGLTNPGPDGYRDLEARAEDFEVFYVFPHPVDEERVLELFAEVARPGALLLCYRGEEEIWIHRRTGTISEV